MIRNEFLKKNIWPVANLIIKESDLASKQKFIFDIFDILFADFKKKWIEENQKFDFSFSFSKKQKLGFRFSYNDFKEENAIFKKKLIDIFKIFPRVYNDKILYQILDYLHFLGKLHQTTFGIDWGNGEKYPRIKIYFEELFHYFSKEERMKQANYLGKLLNFNPRLKGNEDIGALCVDFFPGKKNQLKIYIKFDKIKKYIFPPDKGDFKLIFNSFINFLSLEKHYFNYLTYRMDNSFISSVKLYKIYEVAQIKNFRQSYREIFNFLDYLQYKKRSIFLKRIIVFCKRNNLLFYPVISSIDFFKGGYKFDVYFSIKKNVQFQQVSPR